MSEVAVEQPRVEVIGQRELIAFLNQQREYKELSALVEQKRVALAALEQKLVQAVEAGAVIRHGMRTAQVKTENERKQPSLEFLVRQLGEETGKAVWASLPMVPKKRLVVL